MIAHERRETLLRIEHLHARAGDALVLRDVDAEIKNVVRPGVAQGQVVAILGPSGVGKTTLLRVLAGLLAPAAGRVLLTERLMPVRAGMVGVVHQTYPLFEHRTVLGNLLAAADEPAKARELLVRFGLGDRAGAWPAELSGGERQRVAILQQLMCGHTYLVMDEPFSGLDPLNKAKACELIADVSTLDERTTIIVVTHDIREAIKIADTLWLLGREPGLAGCRIVSTYDLIERELAWTPGIEHTPRFAELARELDARFATL
jgi:polar amino acid transport system ATP-binding protein/sulfate transport system ATP-binding protein